MSGAGGDVRVEYPRVLADALAALLRGGSFDAGRQRLEAIAYRAQVIRPRQAPPRLVRIETFRRDGFHCRYCGRRVMLVPMLQLVGLLYPDLFPFTPNWRGGGTHPAVILCSGVVDHVEPGAWSGAWQAESNLVTACNPCNAAKSDLPLSELPDWTLQPPTIDSEWDGLTRYYAPLWALVEPRLAEIATTLGWSEDGVAREVRYHEGWLRDLTRSTPA
jgi:5-methylcytosine-specific restriction endonuclease McrA